MPYKRTAAEYSDIYKVGLSTIYGWKRKRHPLDDTAAMAPIIESLRSRRNVSKFSSKSDQSETPSQPTEMPEFDAGEGLAAAITRFRQAEKLAAECYRQAYDTRQRRARCDQ
jgi:hypothetical protein